MATSKRFVVITGRPGVGKTTLVKRVLERLASDGISVIGFYCPEVRVGGRRIGFRIESLDGRGSGWLAKISGCDGPMVGRYTTCREAEKVAEDALRGLVRADLVIIDEIGPMELRLPGIRRIILNVIKSEKPGVFVAHYRLRDPEILPVLKTKGYWFEVTPENRDRLVDEVYAIAKDLVSKVRARESS